LGNVTWRPEKGHLIPEVRAANEVTCDFVWDKLHPPISFLNSIGGKLPLFSGLSMCT
jgi:hypothetical protein